MKTLENFLSLSSAEELFEFFGIAYDRGVIESFRLPLLRRFRGYKDKIEAMEPPVSNEAKIKLLRLSLLKAYGEIIREEVRRSGLKACEGCTIDCSVPNQPRG